MGIKKTTDAVYVYEAPVRLWHWINAASLLVLGVTGYLIGSPLHSASGEASDHFIMGYIRYIHFVAAYFFAIGFIGRIYWSFVGNKVSRELFAPAVFTKNYWQGVLHQLRFYAFLEKEEQVYVGHNPVASIAMFLMFTLGSILMILTGGALYAEGQGMGSVWYSVFGWVIPLFGQSQDVHTWHHVGLWLFIVFIMVHIYAAVRDDILSETTIIGSMINGWKLKKGNKDTDKVEK